MSLQAFFEAMGPYLRGQSSHEEVANLLFGKEHSGRDAIRLRAYQEECEHLRQTALDPMFQLTRKRVLAGKTKLSWARLSELYLERHPIRDLLLADAARHFPKFLQEMTTVAGIAPWWPQLADFELRRHRSFIAEDEDGLEGPLRIAASVDWRDYEFGILDWTLVQSSEGPARAHSVVLFWRDGKMIPRQANVGALEIDLLKRVEGQDQALEMESVAPTDKLLIDAMRAAGILVGGST